jgi:Fe-S cluster assembly protein SufD
VSDAAARFVEAFERRSDREPGWLADLRRSAIARFAELGLPGRRDEEFRHTPVDRLLDRELERGAATTVVLPEPVAGETRIVFKDGRFDPVASSLDELPAGVRVRSLAEALREIEDGVPEWLGRCASFESRSLVALNTAFLGDGALVTTAANASADRPVRLVYATTGEGRPTHLRNLIVAEPGSCVEVVEQYVGGDADAVNNVLTEVSVGENASVRHAKLQEEGARTVHLSSVDVRIERDGRFEHHSVATGASTGRTETRVDLAGEGAECDLRGVYLGRGDQHQDQLTLVTHSVGRCRSSQVYRGVLDERARGVFNGLVVVRPDAQGTVAEQQNRNLVLSEEAEAHTRPQLDISADDVRCSHGATVGALDPASLFYLRSRGIGMEQARRLLVRAFASDVLETLPAGAVRDHAVRLIEEWLRG